MPNLFAYLMIFSWPLIAVALFRLLSFERALVWTIIGAHMLLPSETGIKLPGIPTIDRASVAALSALALCAFLAPPRPPLKPDVMAGTVRFVLLLLLGLVVVTPMFTVLQNTQPVIDGKVFLPGLRIKDGVYMITSAVFQLIPFWLGIRYLNTPTGHRTLLEGFVLGGVIYSFPALLEVRLSPQLHVWVYGFFPHSFAQSMRDGGFRPNVFLNHGLVLGIFFAVAIVSAIVLFREARREGGKSVHWIMAAAWLMITLYFTKTLGAFAIAIILGSATLLLGRRLQAMIGVLVAVIVMLYPMLRGSGLIPVDTVYELSNSISEDRGSSLKFRLDNEDALLVRANEKPLVGWGGWARNGIHDPNSGRLTSVTDGIWLIYIGIFGWLGYIGRFGLLTAPTVFFALRQKVFGPSLITPGLIMVLSVALIDLLPNSALVNYVWLMAGGLAGFVMVRQPAEDAAADAGTGDRLLTARRRADWLMAEETASMSRTGRTGTASGRVRRR